MAVRVSGNDSPLSLTLTKPKESGAGERKSCAGMSVCRGVVEKSGTTAMTVPSRGSSSYVLPSICWPRAARGESKPNARTAVSFRM